MFAHYETTPVNMFKNSSKGRFSYVLPADKKRAEIVLL